MSKMVLDCPQCGSPSRIRHSEQMTEHIRLQIFQCKRLGCGCQWKVLAETVAIIAGSANCLYLMSMRPIARPFFSMTTGADPRTGGAKTVL